MGTSAKYKLKELSPCKKCGTYSGKRMMTKDGTQFVVICEFCGYKTGKHPTKSTATKEWEGII